ncbi:hypothetical protein [Pseudomonas sp. 6D_7.1_Bac1]|uniref:hypothetical protein n=1 Tax=Pseudomonas sp. 6D_7.1_Bac1 TaxID=2971615 RepID=UPI0021C7F9C1|nr:hypothetical protein [Pseudomonas sp. 6D_7.1_Bac1]MCU1748559.1 hypothetical protein [Pseudomonas sp. 6D_7.1_Bac1]
MPNSSLPWSLENWKRAAHDDWFMMEEYQFFAPNAILSYKNNIVVGPYTFFFNNMAKRESAQVLITARVKLYINNTSKSEKQETLHFETSVGDEISGLISIGLGIKNFCTGMSRRFHSPGSIVGDLYGEPCFSEAFVPPRLAVPEHFPILPDITGSVYPDKELCDLENLAMASPERYRAFIRASCLYKDALEMVEHDPNLSWILMVSALETAAATEDESEVLPTQQLKDGFPNLFDVLQDSTDSAITERAALIVAPTLKATARFIDFCLRNLPAEPSSRPKNEAVRICWEPESIRKCLSTIYNYRSKYLHAGQRFPSLMSKPPFKYEERPCIEREKDYLNREWKRKEVPINLHTFNYIARHVLLNWCRSFQTA